MGYSFATYLEEGIEGNAPVGVYAAFARDLEHAGFEVDGAWHRDSEGSVALNTLTLTAGPVFAARREKARPFLHVLGGLRHDSIEGSSNTAWGGMAGGGVDIGRGDRLSFRVGADFQIFFDEGENLKTLRLLLGVTF